MTTLWEQPTYYRLELLLSSKALCHLICNHFFRKVKKSGIRKVVLWTRIFFSGQPLFWNQKKKIRVCRTTFSNLKKSGFIVQTTFFSGQPLLLNQKKTPSLQNHFSRIKFLNPDFSNQISKNYKNWGRRIKGSVITWPHFWSIQEHNQQTMNLGLL